MRKPLIALVAITTLVIAGCNKEKIYKENLNGVWTVYKYLFNNHTKSRNHENTKKSKWFLFRGFPVSWFRGGSGGEQALVVCLLGFITGPLRCRGPKIAVEASS